MNRQLCLNIDVPLCCNTNAILPSFSVRMMDVTESNPAGSDDEGELKETNTPGRQHENWSVTSPMSEGDSVYEDAPSRLEAAVDQNPGEGDVEDAGDASVGDNSVHGEVEPQELFAGILDASGVGNDTMYKSASESFFTESRTAETDTNTNTNDPTEAPVESCVEETNDPLGLEDGHGEIDEEEEGELDEETVNDNFQTEPVSSDDENLDAQLDDKHSTANKHHRGTIKQSQRTEDTSLRNLKISDHDLNHEDHVELDYEEDLDEEKPKDGKADEDIQVSCSKQRARQMSATIFLGMKVCQHCQNFDSLGKVVFD